MVHHTSNRGKQVMMAAYQDDAYPVAGLRSGAQSSIVSQQRPSSSSSGSRRPYHHRTSESSSSFCLDDHDDLLEGLSPQGRKSLIMAETAAMIGDRINASAVYGGGDGRGGGGGGDESWSNTISSTDSQWSIASSLSFQDSSVSTSAASDFAGKMDLSSSSILDDNQQQHNLHHSFPAAPPKKRGQHHRRHRRSPNMAMGSQDFFDKVLKDI
mmetsp:Transcript_18359/g.44331  ORF Transcript_18359/g.44331 Transcript_18359/m.44331 type:complete len:212 (-) Transcript_18359:726-1361(-)|eukprot:CAMPEP_0113457116 /NCGR_PEP_ID=MMETSP0014_2-20120614/9240_1 /TAXON_ID=2857 /ORGANISM="Nitzschia sp." /LENGTH=211 /DNA_ID=CAMNT_0000348597 /DNA_START=162 /DNA_END=797 /DNA_ORIENTATION=- /assembly_acc=CAM_ASM_000159